MAFDSDLVRSNFPILNRRINGYPLVYLDSAASAQTPRAVIDAMSRAMEYSYANVHRGLHTLANETTEAYEGARAAAARLVNAPSPDQMVFTKGATEAINLVAAGLGQSWSEGDEIIVSELEHHANYVPWNFLRERKGLVIRFVPVTDDGRLDLDAYERLFTPKTKMVALTHMSNVTGAISDVKRIIAAAHAHGAPVLLDGCQAVVHSKIDVQALDVDFYVFSSHKLYGPTGIGALWARAELLEAMPPWQGGGSMIDKVTFAETTWAPPPQRFEAGTPAIAEAIGFGVAADYVREIGLGAIHAHEAALVREARDALGRLNAVRLLGTAESAGIVSFTIDGVHPHDLGTILDEERVAIRAGHHCAQPLMAHLGVPATARASFAAYSDDTDIAALVRGIERTLRIFA